MAGPFDAIESARTGVRVASIWLDTLGHNIANVNTVSPTSEEPFRAKYLVVRERLDAAGIGTGVEFSGVQETPAEPQQFFDPHHPLADENGIVNRAVVDLAGQMSDLVIASRQYQVNLRVISAAEEAYRAALQIGNT